ncbi:uncharacterized protein LOC119189903 [Manduca sexta]|uniref:uncharacterized protein LOC119189903 n=1 Tax=Manduca sexta TaxID=7130 RepID=UPI0018902E0A|nr:uncharacterized protein LOC119189903 [Manduca sexta]
MSDSNFHTKEEITKRSMVTEHKINEIEEVKTIKKIVLNGYESANDSHHEQNVKTSSENKNKAEFDSQRSKHIDDFKPVHQSSSKRERMLLTPTTRGNSYFNSTFTSPEKGACTSPNNVYQTMTGEYKINSVETRKVAQEGADRYRGLIQIRHEFISITFIVTSPMSKLHKMSYVLGNILLTFTC